ALPIFAIPTNRLRANCSWVAALFLPQTCLSSLKPRTECADKRPRQPGPVAPRRSRNEILDHFSGNVGQPEIAALKTVSKPSVVESEQAKNRGVEIVYVNGIFDDVPSKLVRLAEYLAALDSAPRHPNTKRKRMMVAPGDLFVADAVLTEW